MNQLVDSPYGADVTVYYDAVEVDAVAVVPLYELQAPLEVTESQVPNMDYGDCFLYQLRCSVAIRAEIKDERVHIVVFFRRGRVTLNASSQGFSRSKMEMVPFRVAVSTENRLRPIVDTTRI